MIDDGNAMLYGNKEWTDPWIPQQSQVNAQASETAEIWVWFSFKYTIYKDCDLWYKIIYLLFSTSVEYIAWRDEACSTPESLL